MEDYPRNLSEFNDYFSTGSACRDYLFRLRWPDGFQCPRGKLFFRLIQQAVTIGPVQGEKIRGGRS